MLLKVPLSTLGPFLLAVALLPLIRPCHPAKFLFTFFHDSGSHFGSMRPLMEMLARRGHSVAMLDTIFPKDVSPLFRHIRATIPREEDEQFRRQFAHVLWHSRLTAHSLVAYYAKMDRILGELLDKHAEKVVELLDEHWDFIVVDDLFWSLGFGLTSLKHRLWQQQGQEGSEPHIVVYSTAAQGILSASSAKSVGRNWVSRVPMCPWYPVDSGNVFSPEKFTHRVFAFYETFAEFIFMDNSIPPLMPNIGRLGLSKFSWHEFYSRNALELSDSVDRIGWPLAVGADMINVGAHCKQPGELPREFVEFMEMPDSKGTIYAAFGTHADWIFAPSRVTDALFGAFNRLKQYRIIFVYNGPKPANLDPHVLLVKWAPQLAILAHPLTRAFLSHGGNKSVREGLCAGVPLIAMPIYAEQAHSAHLLLAMGIAPVINKFELDEQSVFQTISGVIATPKSAKRAKQFQSMFLDRPIGAMEEGILAMERLERRGRGRAKGRWREFSQRRGMHLGWAQFAHLDLLLLATTICAILSL